MLTLELDTSYTFTKEGLWTVLGPGGVYKPVEWRIADSQPGMPPGMTNTREVMSGTPTEEGDAYSVVLEKDMGFGEYRGNTIPITVPAPPMPPGDALAQRLAAFLGAPDDPEIIAVATVHLPIVTAMVKSYTRDKGFTEDVPNGDLSAVIITAGARLVVNPEQAIRVQIGDTTETPAVFNGFTLAELAILNRYRKRSA